LRGLLIGGTSHCGKSTMARQVGDALGLPVQSTDELARHPGRPWLGIPAPVAEFYQSLSNETIYWFLRVHHTNMWPLLAHEIGRQLAGPGGFVMEGSALRPEHLAYLEQDDVLALCLYADAEFLAERIRRESDYEARQQDLRQLIDAFIVRSVRDNKEVIAAAREHRVWLVDAADTMAMVEAKATIMARMAP
jgi:2-phosphoglycerate kinase